MIISAPISRFVLLHYYNDLGPSSAISSQAAYTFTIARWDALAIGALFALMYTQNTLAKNLKKTFWPLLIVISVLALVQLIQYKNIPALGNNIGILNQTWVALGFALLLSYFIKLDENKSFIIKLMESWLFKTSGKYSYALYIVHIPVMHIYLKYFAFSLEGFSGLGLLLMVNLNCIAVFALSMMLAALTWRFIEKPFLDLKHRFR